MKPTLYLHIGCGKTGTTAIQTFFWDNREVLESRGVVYPEIGSVSSAHHLISPFRPDFAAEWTFLDPPEWCPELAGLRKDTFLMSSELICWSGADEARRFAGALSAHFDLQVVAYVRRQDELVMAGYNQQVKVGFQTQPLSAIIDQQTARFDFWKMLSPWSEALGADSITVRNYDRAEMKNGNVVEDFCASILGISDLGAFHFSENDINSRLGVEALEFKRLINCLASTTAESGRFIEGLARFRGTKKSELLSGEQKSYVMSKCRESNDLIARHFFGLNGAAELFADRVSDHTCSARVQNEDLSAVAAFMKESSPDDYSALGELVRGYAGPNSAEHAILEEII